MHQNKQGQYKIIVDMSFFISKLSFSKLRKLMLIFVTKRVAEFVYHFTLYLPPLLTWIQPFSKLRKLTLILVTKKSCRICLHFHLILASLIKLNTTFPSYLSTPFTLAGVCLHLSPLMSSTILLSMTKVDETDGSLHTFCCRKMTAKIKTF